MAMRRYGQRAKSPAVSTAGHNEKPEQAAPAEQHPLGSEPTPPSAPAPEQKADAQPEHFRTGLGDQLAAMRAYAQPDPLDQYIAFHFPGTMPHERQWLRANQHHLGNPHLINQAAAIALQRGIPRQSPEFLQAVGALIDHHHAAMQAASAPPQPPPIPEPPPMPHAHIDIETEHDDEPERAAAMVSAPPSRGSEHYAGVLGDAEPSPGSVTLSRAEREHAQAAQISEIEYAKQKLRMQKAKRAGLIKD
jgi:hypothetical protein